MRATPARVMSVMGILLVLLLAAMALSLGLGAAAVSPSAIWHWLIHRSVESSEAVILGYYRVPRILVGALVGASLSLCGTVFQGSLRNYLAEPFILGISGGAALGAVTCILFGAESVWSVSGAAFAGAAVATILVMTIHQRRGRSDTASLVLTGVMLNAFFTAVIMFMIAVATEQKLHAILFWIYGDLSGAGMVQAYVLLPTVLIGGVVLYRFSTRLNLLAAGELAARTAGVETERTKFILMAVVSVMCGVTVSFSGLIGFVGLIVPHIIRMLLGHDHRLTMPAGALAGAVFLVLADTGARTIISPAQLPVGVVTAFLGAPFFVLLLARRGSRWWL